MAAQNTYSYWQNAWGKMYREKKAA